MRERDLFLAMLQPGVYVARIVERFYGAPNWVVVEEFDVSRDIAGILEAAQPKDVEPEAPAEEIETPVECGETEEVCHEGEVVTE